MNALSECKLTLQALVLAADSLGAAKKHTAAGQVCVLCRQDFPLDCLLHYIIDTPCTGLPHRVEG